ncbi:hypothetical protein PMAC_002847 [Pneumocystis sp. 'macacae']|nr:hypothetical protein PMAC_002847 [Pneumocystis sp. 'macacae']
MGSTWTRTWVYGMGGFFGAAALVCAYRPETSIAAWARQRAAERAHHTGHGLSNSIQTAQAPVPPDQQHMSTDARHTHTGSP